MAFTDFFLLRPGEYTSTAHDDATFTLFLGDRRLHLATATIPDLEAATSVGLYFTIEKNQRKGDTHMAGATIRSVVQIAPSYDVS